MVHLCGQGILKMGRGLRYGLLLLLVLAVGGLRMPFEQRLALELRRENLLPPRLEIETGEKIGQTFSAVSLGGLRTLVATFFNLRAQIFFEQQQWADVAKTYDLIVDLAPRTGYYWDTGTWHLAYNAASHYLYESELPPLRRKTLWKNYIMAGRRFLERGIRNHPDDAQLLERMGSLMADPNKTRAFGEPAKAFEASFAAYQAAVATGNARSYTKRAALYSLVRVPGREEEALELVKTIRAEQNVSQPSIMALHYALEYQRDPAQDVLALVDRVFPDRRGAYQILNRQWMRGQDRFPMHGVARAIALLEFEFGVDETKSVLRQPLPLPVDPDDYFRRR